MPKNFSALLTRDIGNCIFFCGAKKNQTNGAAGEKKFRVRCKNLAFSAQSHTSNPFLRSKKGKMAPQAKKKLRYSLDGAVSNPVPMVLPWFNTMRFFFFFFFSDFCCAATELYTVAEPLLLLLVGGNLF